jgi:predicted nucleotidyltransferase
MTLRARQAGQSVLLLLDVVAVFKDQAIDYAVIGAVAASVHGELRATADADALISVTAAKLARLGSTFKNLGFETELRRGDADDPIPAMLIIGDTHGNRVDLLGGLRGLDPRSFSRTVEIRFSGESLRIIGREDFIAMKCYAGGPQDIADARAAFNGAQQPIDLDLLREVTRRFGRTAADILEHVIGR